MSTAEQQHRLRKRPLATVTLNGENTDDSDIEEIPVKQPRKSGHPNEESSFVRHFIDYLSWLKAKCMFLSFVNSALKALGVIERGYIANEPEEVELVSESDTTYSEQVRSSHSVSDRTNRFLKFGSHYRSGQFIRPSQTLFGSSTNQISSLNLKGGYLRHSPNYRSPFKANGHSRPPNTLFNRPFGSSKKKKEENEENEVTVLEDKSYKLLDNSCIIKDRSHVPLRRRGSNDDVLLTNEVPPSDVLLSRTKLVLRPNNTPVSPRSIRGHSRSLTSLREKNKFTTNDVINIQEKEVYKMLLDNYYTGPSCVKEAELPTYKITQTQVKPQDNKEASSAKDLAIEKFIEEYNQKLEVVPQSALPKPKVTPARPIFKQLTPEDEVLFLREKPFKYKEKPTKPLYIPPAPQSPFMSKEWLNKLKQSVEEETKACMKIAAEQNRQIEESRRKAREELEAKALSEAAGAREEDFPELTPEMERIIDNALIPDPPDELLSQFDGLQVLRKDMDTLNSRNWLNDEIINFYLRLVQERSKQRTDLPSVYTFSSFFFPSLKTKGYSSVKRWTRRFDVFDYDIILVPVHLGVHWCLAVIDFRYKHIGYYDSMGGNETCLDVLKNYLMSESLDKKKKELDMSDWNLEVMKKIPPQMNGYDCGMFTLKYAEYVTRDAPITFNQQNMQYFRRIMVYEIMMQRIL